MSGNNDRFVQDQYNQGGHTSDTSKNIGNHQAQQGWPSSPQQHNESYTSWLTRQDAYDWTKKQNGG
ncbi:MAG: hypothetical protein IPK23_10170 [Rhizobiales bacterium]|jgi:hypothetical protein|nr:hypothetical protein [Hyphomicrobiales bacterium]